MKLEDLKPFLDLTYGSVDSMISFILPEDDEYRLITRVGGGSFTDGRIIQIGIPEFMVDELDEVNGPKFDELDVASAQDGLGLHEVGHKLYSSFSEFKKFQEKIAIKLEARGIDQRIGRKIGAHLLNCTEDGRIEKRVANRFPGALKYFRFLNGTIWSIQELKEERELKDLLMGIVSIAVSGLLPKGFMDIYKGKRLDDVMKKLRPMIIEAINAPTAKTCCVKTEEIYDEIEDLLVELLEEEQKDLEAFDELMEMLKELPDFTSEGSAQGEGSGEGSGEGVSTHFVPEGSEGEDGSGSGEGVGASSTEEGKEGKGKTSTFSGQAGGSGASTVEAGDTKALEEQITRSVEEAKEMARKESEGKVQPPKPSKKEEKGEIDLDDLVKQEVNGKYTDETVRTFREEPRRFSLMSLPTEYRPEALKFRKEVEKFFVTQRGLNLHKMNSGKLTSKDLYRVGMKEYNVFTKVGHPSQTDAVIEICWDGSGSMCGSKQFASAKACAIIEEGFKGIVPLKIVNFTVDWHASQVVHHLVKDFDENSKSQNYSWSYGQSKSFTGGNKDGYDIRVCTEELLKRPEKDKILIVLSDGLPSDYTRIRPEDDVKSAVKEAREKGVYVVALFFGDERFRESTYPTYEYMYQKNIINSAPEEISSKLVKILKKLVLR